MPKILVADDNSNVQRTVTLALSDLGVEVVAVNNGEAAVRKLSDFAPDLILADIFMPVRNGYEVCEYVKRSPKFAQTPVVLLVGAFDPFDEREAQRVGADGILKKPFVPPDPLIAMVRTLLDRVMASRPVPAAVSAGLAAITQRSLATSGMKVFPEEEETEVAPEKDFGSRGRVEFGVGERPVAFGDMFDMPAAEVEAVPEEASGLKDETFVVTSTRDAALGDPGFWRKDQDEEQPVFEAAIASEAANNAPQLVERPWESAIAPAAEPETHAIIPAEPAFEIIRDLPEETLTSASTDSILQDPAVHSALTVDANKAADLAANPLDWMASAPPLPSEPAEAESLTPLEPEVEALVESSVAAPAAPLAETPAAPKVETPAVTPAVISVIAPVQTVTPKQADPIPEPHAMAEAESSTPIEPEVEALVESSVAAPAAPLAETPAAPKVKTPAVTPAVIPVMPPAQIVTPKQADPIQEPHAVSAQPVSVDEQSSKSIDEVVPVMQTKAADPAPAEKWADLAAVVQEEAKSATEQTALMGVANPEPVSPMPPSPVAASPQQLASSDPAVIDAVVQRVMEKISPQVIDIITREFLRPVVQALVKREIDKR